MDAKPETTRVFLTARSLADLDLQAHIEARSGVRERANGDEIDARLRDRAHVLERDAARGLGRRAAVRQLDGAAHVAERHVVEQERCRPGIERFASLFD
jgi:hypothetical protein